MQVPGTPHASHASSAVGSPPTWWLSLVALVLLALVLASYSFGVLLPYFANDLHRLPLAEVASGAHDPKDMWPQGGSALPGLVQLTGLLAVVFGPLVVLGALLAVPWTLWSGWGRASRSARALGLATTVLALAMAAVLLSPVGGALATWRLD